MARVRRGAESGSSRMVRVPAPGMMSPLVVRASRMMAQASSPAPVLRARVISLLKAARPVS